MDKLRVTRKFVFDMAHALYGYDGPCKNIHGHTYHLEVTLIGTVLSSKGNSKDGMVIDFGDLKKVINENVIHYYDHALVLNGASPHREIAALKTNFEKVIYFAGQPTCENLLLDMVGRIAKVVPVGLKLTNVKLAETETSYAEWFYNDNV